MAMKYIIFQTTHGFKLPFIFPSTMDHSDFAKRFPELTPVSAGIYQCDTQYSSMCGDSFTLGIKSDPGDRDILKRNADFY